MESLFARFSSKARTDSNVVTGTPDVIAQYVYRDIIAVKNKIRKYNEITGIFVSNALYYKIYKLIEGDHASELQHLKKKFEYNTRNIAYQRQLLDLYKNHLDDFSNLLDVFKNNYNHGIYESKIVNYRLAGSNEQLTEERRLSLFSSRSSISTGPSRSSTPVQTSGATKPDTNSTTTELGKPKEDIPKKDSKMDDGAYKLSTNLTDEEKLEIISQQAPDNLLDPISFNLFSDPVITPSGITYERGHLVQHLKRKGKFDPLTRDPLQESQLYPNLVVKDTVQAYIESILDDIKQT